MGPHRGRAEGKENLPRLLPTLLLMHPRIPSWQPGHAAGSWSPCRPPAPETDKPLWGADVTVTGSSGPTSSRPGAMLQEQGSNGGLGGDQQGEGAGASCTQLRKGQRKKLAMCRNVVVWHSLGNERRRKGLQCTQADLEVSSYTLPSCWARESTRSPEEAEVKTLRRTSVSSVLAQLVPCPTAGLSTTPQGPSYPRHRRTGPRSQQRRFRARPPSPPSPSQSTRAQYCTSSRPPRPPSAAARGEEPLSADHPAERGG